MTAASDYLEGRILDDYFVGKTVYVALWPTVPTDAVTATGGVNLPRQPATFTRAANSNRAVLSADLNWTNAPATDVAGVVLFDAATGGNVLTAGPLTMPDPANPTGPQIPAPLVHLNAGDAYRLAAGSLSIVVD